MMSLFNLTVSEKHFILPSILNDSFAGYSNLGCRSLRLILGNVTMVCIHWSLLVRALTRDQTHNLSLLG